MLLYKLPKGYDGSSFFDRQIVDLYLSKPEESDRYIQTACERIPPKDEIVKKTIEFHYEFLKNNYPVFCVKADLISDFEKTDLVNNGQLFKNYDINMPKFTVFFPKNTVKSNANGAYLLYFIFNIKEKNDGDNIIYEFNWIGKGSDDDYIYSSRHIIKDTGIWFTLISPTKKDIDDEGEKIRKHLTNIAMHIIICLQYFPYLIGDIEDDDLSHHHKNKGFGKPHKPSINDIINRPRWIQDKSPVKESHPPATSTGTHRSPRTHFRRGHYRLVKEQLVRVKPAWVNKGK